MRASELLSIVQESSRKLLQISIPAVRFYLLTDVMEMRDDDPLVLRAADEIRRAPKRIKLLDTLRSDGTWPISRERRLAEERGPGPPVGWTYITMLRNLQLLEDMKTHKEEGHISEALEKILSWQKKEGYVLGPYHDIFPLPHYNGYAVRNLFIYGLDNDPRVKKMADWLLSIQRRDGGWVIPYVEDVKYLPEYKHMRAYEFLDLVRGGRTPRSDPKGFKDIPSCTWTTMMDVRGLARSEEYRRMKELRRGADFFLDRFFQRNWHEAYYHTEGIWTRLVYPPYIPSGITALYLLSMLGYGPSDERMDKPMRWLLSARHPDGFWWQSERPYTQKDQWITGFALDILARYARNK